MANRKLSPVFIQDLQSGILHHFLSLVKNDHTLTLEIRADELNIYYRGGSILKISEQKNSYKIYFNPQYLTDAWKEWQEDKLSELPSIITSEEDSALWLHQIPLLKQAMDFWFGSHPKVEREYQQLLVRDNNFAKGSHASDYFIVDVEYDNHDGARFDAIAIKWQSKASSRKLLGEKPLLSFIEVKFYDTALDGKCGMHDHIRDMNAFLGNPENYKAIKQEMLELFQQKRELGLVAGLESNPNQITEFSDGKPEFIFVLANHDPDSSKLQSIIDSLEPVCYYDVKFAVSNFMGYGLFTEGMFSLEEFKEKFAKQIYSKNHDEIDHSKRSE